MVHLALEFFSIILSIKKIHSLTFEITQSTTTPCCQLHRDICFCGKFFLVRFFRGRVLVRLY